MYKSCFDKYVNHIFLYKNGRPIDANTRPPARGGGLGTRHMAMFGGGGGSTHAKTVQLYPIRTS